MLTLNTLLMFALILRRGDVVILRCFGNIRYILFPGPLWSFCVVVSLCVSSLFNKPQFVSELQVDHHPHFCLHHDEYVTMDMHIHVFEGLHLEGCFVDDFPYNNVACYCTQIQTSAILEKPFYRLWWSYG